MNFWSYHAEGNPLSSLLTGSFLGWLPLLVSFIALTVAGVLYVRRSRSPQQFMTWIRRLVGGMMIFQLAHAAFLTAGQYYIWSQTELTRTFLNSPTGSNVPPSLLTKLFSPILESHLGYFAFYSWGRFWISALLTIFVSLVFMLFLKMLAKHQERFFERGEVLLGGLAALAVGWPGIVIFVPAVFLTVVLVSIFRLAVLHESHTTLGWPLLLAGFLTLFAGQALVTLLGLQVLKI